MDRKNIRMIVIFVCILVVLTAALVLIDMVRNQSGGPEHPAGTGQEEGEETSVPKKHLTLRIVFGDGSEKTIPIETDAETLRGALETVDGLVAGDESLYGLFVTAVDGVSADSGKQEWWCFSRGGETLMTGIDDTPVSDGETYEATLKTGY